MTPPSTQILRPVRGAGSRRVKEVHDGLDGQGLRFPETDRLRGMARGRAGELLVRRRWSHQLQRLCIISDTKG
jgi:hypothetical protein